MTNWRPSSGPEVARRRATMLDRIRQFFCDRDVLAVDMPALSRFAVSDTQIESFLVQSGSLQDGYLSTSPEFNMKRLLAAGYPDIYSICRVFRDGEAGAKHQPEFTMVEWYRLGLDLHTIVTEAIQLIADALANPALGDDVDHVDYADAFKRYAGIDVFTASIDNLANLASADAGLRSAIGDDRDGWLDLILGTVVVKEFATDRLTVLRHYPASQAALARVCPTDSRVADRFEVFYGSSELANGYVELTDANEQLRRIESDQSERKRSGRTIRPWDTAFMASLTAGLPECAGVAVGLERLQMVYDKTDDIRDVIAFAYENHHD